MGPGSAEVESQDTTTDAHNRPQAFPNDRLDHHRVAGALSISCAPFAAMLAEKPGGCSLLQLRQSITMDVYTMSCTPPTRTSIW